MKKLLACIILILIAFATFGQEILWEGGWRYFDLPSGEKAIGSFLPGDDLRYSVGSASLNSATVAERWNANQMTFLVNIPHLNFVPGDGLYHYLVDNKGTSVSRNRLRLYCDTVGTLYFQVQDKDSTNHYVDYDASGWSIGEKHLIVAVVDFNNDSIALYVDSSLEDDVPTGALSSDSFDAIEANTHIGSDSSAANQLNGGMTIQVFNDVKDAAWVLDQWNSGDLRSAVCTPDTILMSVYGD